MALPNISPTVKVYYGKPILPEVSRVLACLYEKDFKLVAFQNVDCMPVDLIRLQASTSVPTPFFEDESKFLFESRAICRYISETYADRGNRYLLGRDLLDRVSIEQWLKSEEQSFDPPSRALVLHLAFPLSSNKSYNDLLEESERLAKVLDMYNHCLGESRYLAGDEFTLADLTHLPNSRYIATSNEWGHLFYERENVKRWWEDVSTRPSWSKVEDEIERSKEEEDEEEMTQEMEENFIGITRSVNPKMSLKASIFQPIEASVQLPVKPKSTLTISKNVASPRGSVQVTVPDKREFSVSVPEQKVTQVETTRTQPHTKQTVADAKVTMEESTIPTARIDKASTEETRVISESTKPVTDAKVTIEGSDVLPTGTQMPSTARIDKTRTKQTRVLPQSTNPVTDTKVTVEKTSSPSASTEVPPTHETTPESAKVTEKYAAYPTDETSISKSRGFPFRQTPTSTSKTEQPTKLSLEGTKAPLTEKTTEKPLTRDQGQTLSPPTTTEVTPTHETTTESAKVPEKYTASQADETRRSDSRGLRFIQVPVPTSKAVQPIKQSPKGPQSPPTEKTTTKTPTIDQGQTLNTEVPPTHETTTESAKVTEKYTASQADETRSESRGFPFAQVSVPTSKTVQPTKQSPEGPQSPPTEKTTTKTPTIDQGQTLNTEVPPTHETTTESAKVTEKYTASQADETRSESRDFPFAQVSVPTSKTVQPTKQSPEGPQSPPTEKTTTKTPTIDQGQTLNTEVPPTHETTTESAKVTEKYTASQADETRSESRGFPFAQVSVPTSKTVQPTKQSPEGPQSPATEKTTTKLPTTDPGQNLTAESKHDQTAEELTNKEDEPQIYIEAYLSAKHKKWVEQLRNPEKFGEEKDAKVIPAQKPQPPKIEDMTPSTTQSSTTTSSETARQEPVPYKSTNTPAKDPSESRTTAKPKDTTPSATQAKAIPAVTQDTAVGKTTGASSSPSAGTRGLLSQSTSETQNGITGTTKNVPAPKPAKHEGSTTPTPATITTSQTEISQDEKSSSSKTPSSNNQNRGEFSQDEKSSSAKETALTSDGRNKAPNTFPKQKETQNETKMETKIGSDQLGISKPNQITSQPNKTDDANPMNESLSETNRNKASPEDRSDYLK